MTETERELWEDAVYIEEDADEDSLSIEDLNIVYITEEDMS